MENSPKDLPDKSDLERVFFELFMNCQKGVFAYILSSVHHYADANDLFQETATVLWQKFDEFDQGTNFQAWAISIARNMVRSYFNRHKRSRLQFDDNLVKKIEDQTVSKLRNHDSRVESLKKCFEKLSDSNRQLMKLRYEQGMTVKLIASRLGKPLHGMYKYMARLQNSLLECIEKAMALSK